MIVEKAIQLGLETVSLDQPQIRVKLTTQYEKDALRQLSLFGIITDMCIVGVNDVHFGASLSADTKDEYLKLVAEWAAYLETHEGNPARLSVGDWFSLRR